MKIHELPGASKHLVSAEPMVEGTEVERLGPRIVVYGSNMSGALAFVEALGEEIKSRGFSDKRVVNTTRIDRIEDTFFRGKRPDTTPPLQGSVVVSIGGAEVRAPFNPRVTPEDGMSLPDMVFVFPEMRRYDPDVGSDSVGTPYERIAALCDQFNVPVVRIESFDPAAGLPLDELVPGQNNEI